MTRELPKDFRVVSIRDKLKRVGKVVVVLSTKGGVGKTTVATMVALRAGERGVETALLDLDMTNPTSHIILGLSPEQIKYKEERGVVPYEVGRVKYFSPVAYTMDRPTPLRGGSLSEALRELLTILRLDGIRLLIIDTPPTLSDGHLELIYGLRGLHNPLLVSTPSALSVKSALKLVEMLREAGAGDIMLVENMGTGELRDLAQRERLKYLGYIPYMPEMEKCLGSVEKALACPGWEWFDAVTLNLLRELGLC